MHQTIKQIPAHLAVRAVLPALDLIAALIVFVVGAGVFPQQVVEQFAVWWRQLQRTASLNSFFIQQVTRRVEIKVFCAQTAHSTEQSTDRVITIRGLTTSAVKVAALLATSWMSMAFNGTMATWGSRFTTAAVSVMEASYQPAGLGVAEMVYQAHCPQ